MREHKQQSERAFQEVQKQLEEDRKRAEEDRKQIEELTKSFQTLLAQSETKQPMNEDPMAPTSLANPPVRSGRSIADLMFVEMRLPTLTGKENQSEMICFFYKFRAGTANHTTQEKKDLLEAKIAGKAARLWEHTSMASESSDFDQNLAEFESELKSKAADHRDWPSIYLCKLSKKIVPRVDQNIQIPGNCLKDNMFLKSFLPAKGCKFKFLEENHGFSGDFDKKNSIEWSYSSRIEGKGTKF
ncbi:unnamed protein product [Bursaphelenchus xylophilus]|uniref:(pine wood nematode) hypothetical protein n=1 Tax=Bursaphelenchus xylophilus TaxID=6326 RepID=A0A1I7SHP3_BURXY|nr:unnamed protein product [Bursaphelenchus xylophilus]CAG9126202.1 unnamed protein product [Bursaphelenchus xylophilus]